MQKIKALGKALKNAAIGFVDDNAFKLSASLSYYTVFALGPLLIIIISLTGIFFGKEAVQGRVYGQLTELVGSESALQIQDIIINIQTSHSTTTGAIIGVAILFIGATGVFTEMQDSINYIWSIKTKPKKSIVKFFFDRLISFSLIISFGFILMVSLAVHALVDLLHDKLQSFFNEVTVIVFQGFNYIILFVVITTLFAVIFKILPDARIRWKDTFVGATFTAVLFLVGKSLIGLYLGNSDIGVTYGAAASVVNHSFASVYKPGRSPCLPEQPPSAHKGWSVVQPVDNWSVAADTAGHTVRHVFAAKDAQTAPAAAHTSTG